MANRAPCYFCESFIDVDVNDQCPHCRGSVDRTARRAGMSRGGEQTIVAEYDYKRGDWAASFMKSIDWKKANGAL